MNKFIFSLILLVTTFSLTVVSQTVEPSASIDKNTLQIELESIYAIQKEGNDKLKSWSIPSLLLRYGMSNAIELQLNVPIIKENLYEDDHLVHSLHKFDDMQLGFSLNLWKEQKLLPEAALMVRAIIPIHKNLKFDALGKVLSLNLSNTLSNSFSLNYNIGYVEETNNKTSGFYIANLNYQLNSKINVFMETFGDFSSHYKATHNINIGGDYSIHENVCLGFSIANGIKHELFYIGGILTWTINTKII